MNNTNTQLLFINSKDRSSGEIYDFNYTFKNYPPVGNKVRYRINKITIPFAFYQTPAQTFVINYGSAGNLDGYVIPLPAGNYTPQTLINKLNELMTSEVDANALIWTYEDGVFTVSVLNPSNRVQLVFNTTDLPIDQMYKSIGYQMGYFLVNPDGTSTYTIPAEATSQSSLFTAILQLTTNIYVKSQALSNSSTSFFQTTADYIIQSVSIDVNPNNYINYENQYVITFPVDGGASLSVLDFQLLDDFGNFIILTLDWVIEIQYFYLPKY